MAFGPRLERNRPEGKEKNESFTLRTHYCGDGSRQDDEELISWDDLLDTWDDRAAGPVAEEEERENVSYVSLVMRAWGGAVKREFATNADHFPYYVI